MFNSIINTVAHGIFSGLWYIFVWFPFKILATILDIFNWLGTSLANILLFGSKSGQITNYVDKETPFSYIIFSITAILLVLIFLISAIIRWVYQKNSQNKESVWSIIWRVIPVILIIVSIPLIIYVFYWLVYQIFDVLKLGFGNKNSIAQSIFNSLKPDQIKTEQWESLSANNSFTVIDYYNYIKLEWGEGVSILLFLGLTGILVSWVFFLGGITLVIKVFHQFFLYIISPLIASTIIFDHGKRMNIWKDLFLSKTLSIFGFIIGIHVFSLYLSMVNGWVGQMDSNGFTKKIILILLAIGGALATQQLTHIISAFVGESSSVRETLAETKGLLQAGMPLMALGGALPAAAGAISAGIGLRNTPLKGIKKEFKDGKISNSEYKAQKAEIKTRQQFDGLNNFARNRSGLIGGAAGLYDSIKGKKNPYHKEKLESYYNQINSNKYKPISTTTNDQKVKYGEKMIKKSVGRSNFKKYKEEFKDFRNTSKYKSMFEKEPKRNDIFGNLNNDSKNKKR